MLTQSLVLHSMGCLFFWFSNQYYLFVDIDYFFDRQLASHTSLSLIRCVSVQPGKGSA